MDEPLTRRERKAREAAERARSAGSDAAPAHPVDAPRPPHAGAGYPGPPPGDGPGPAAARPVIRPAHRTSAYSSAYPEPGHGARPAPSRGDDTRMMNAPADARAAVATAFAEPVMTNRGPDGPEDPAGGARRGRPEPEPLGCVRGTVRTFGELCITAGLVLILFVVWQLWWTDIAANEDNANLADQLTSEWAENPRNELPPDPETPYVAEPVDMNSAFGIVYIPRFGEDYYRTMAEGVSMEPVLNRMGLGRYPNAAMPGEVGNFALAGHRVTYGKPLNLIAELRPGDEIIVQTADGFYTYTFRNFDIVLPDATEVLAPVPDMPDFKGKDRIMTLTACNPMFSAQERYIAYAELTDWQPAAEGVPERLQDSPAYAKANEGVV